MHFSNTSTATLLALLFTTTCLSLSVAAREAATDPSDKNGGATHLSAVRNRGRSLLFEDFQVPCFGIFFECEEEEDDAAKTKAPTPAPIDYSLCANQTDGIFGGRPIFGECGVFSEFWDGLFRWNDSDNDGEVDEFAIGNPLDDDGSLFLSLFPKGSLLWDIFNGEDNETFVEEIMASFRDITDVFSNGFLDDWSKTIVMSKNETCANVTAVEPVCLTHLGREGFWVCRRLYDPFSGIPSNQSSCIDKGEFLARNDLCGCCGNSCPKSCPCKCNLDGINDGVLVTNSLFGINITIGNQCVKPEFATAVTSRYGNNINCVEKCPATNPAAR